MGKDRCCSCQSARHGTCQNCACAKEGKGCVDCLLSRDGLCKNSFGSGLEESKTPKIKCPYDGCTSGRYGTPMIIRLNDITRLRFHLSDHIREKGYVVPEQWLRDTNSRLCPSCQTSIVGLSGKCDGCKKRVPDACFNVSAPRARHLPKLEQNHVTQVSLGATEAVLSAGLPPIDPPEDHGPGVFEVEKIIGKRRVKKKRVAIFSGMERV